METITREITKEEYEKAKKEGTGFLFDASIVMGYGLYGSRLYEKDGFYFLEYTTGSSCD